ncbi:MAG: class I SAM-dependent methyltransferase [Gammaproteobacteria bacterium]|jgi:SAM-dependent methyltransferase
MNQKDHWEQVYSAKPPDKLGWYEPHLTISVTWLQSLGLPADVPIIDVGSGTSTFVDDLLAAGYQFITVLDISEQALSANKTRLGNKADNITWLQGDITSIDLPSHYYALWHDRAVFHFLTTRDQQENYRNNLLKALKPGGHLIIGTFSLEAPPTCSGLPVQRYSPDQLEFFLGTDFEINRAHKEMHITPGGVEQMYLYCLFRRKL